MSFIEEWAKNDSDHVEVSSTGQERFCLFFCKLYLSIFSTTDSETSFSGAQRIVYYRNELLRRVGDDRFSYMVL